MTHRIRRSLLIMPGDDRHKIEKGAALNVDSIIMDLEDGVALNQKQIARETVAEALRDVPFGQTERLVRINPVNENLPLWREDIEATIESNPDGYVIPKVEHPSQIRMIEDQITRAERTYGWVDGRIRLLAIVETARGIVNLRKITRKSRRLTALVFGAEDLAGDIGAVRTPDGWEVFYARSALVLHARAAGLQAIDTPFVDLAAEDSNLIADAEQAHYMGYTGKLAVHPRQVEPIHKVFTPSEERIQRAKILIGAFAAHQAEGQGVFVLDGRMVDMPMVKAAEAVLEMARSAGIDVDSL